jgi:hypothetical protein
MGFNRRKIEDRRREAAEKEAATRIDRVVADIPNAEKGFILIFFSTPFPVTNIGSIGGGQKLGEIGITRPIWTWRAGCARRLSDTSPTPRFFYTPR